MVEDRHERTDSRPKAILLGSTEAIELPFGGSTRLDAVGHPCGLAVGPGFDLFPRNRALLGHFGERGVGRFVVELIFQHL